MPRAKSIAAIRHRKVKKAAKGFKHSAGKRVRTSKEALLHAGQYAYVGRRLRKRDMRRLWIQRINAGLSQIEGAPKYSRFINLLKIKNVDLDRKVLADLAVSDSNAFEKVVAFSNS